MRTFLFEVNYKTPSDINHMEFVEKFTNGIADLHRVKNIEVENYCGLLNDTTHTAKIEIYAESINHQQLFGKVYIVADEVGIIIKGIPNEKMRFSDE